ncbi:MAG: MFS transporter [Actinomycetota bacterium]
MTTAEATPPAVAWQLPEIRAVAAAIAGTSAGAMPAFLTGAIAVQLIDEIGLDARTLGFCLGGYFTTAAAGSAVLGRLAERVGPVVAMRLAVGLALTVSLLLATLTRSTATLGGLLLVGGLSNAFAQPSANLLLVERVRPERHGFAFALKQAGMPVASLVGGLLVPTIALTVGWRWTYVVAAGIAAAALLILGRSPAVTPLRRSGPGEEGHDRPDVGVEAVDGPVDDGPRKPDLPLSLLLLYALVGLLAASTAGALMTFLVASAEAVGLAEGPAGLVLAGGSAVGVVSRLIHGRLADGPRLLPIRRVALLLAIGAVGVAGFAIHQPWAYVSFVFLAFGAGWSWPGLFQLSVVRNNPSAPAAATGISQTGIYVGAALGPVVGGVIADAYGFRALWLVGAGALLTASALATVLRVRLRAHRVAAAAATPT